MEKAIAAKRTAFKAWKAGKGTRASYDAGKRNARHAVHHAGQEADKKVYKNIDPKSSEVYCLANQFRRENRVSLSASTRENGTHWKEATTAVSS